MTLSEFLSCLDSRGNNPSVGVVRYAIMSGKLGQIPKDGAGNNSFDQIHVERMESYLASPRRRGRSGGVK